jgi:hypothetical protein
MRLAALIVAGIVVMTAQAAGKEPAAPKTVFGIVWDIRDTWFAKLDARTLKPVSKRVPLGLAASYLGRSPGGGNRLAFTVGEAGTAIAFVNLSSMKREGRVALPCGVTAPILWRTARRLVTTCGGSASSVVVVDPVSRKVRARKSLAVAAELIAVERANASLVGLMAPLGSIGQARLVVVDASARIRSVALPGIRAGTQVLDQNTSRFRTEIPALAIDPGGVHAAVIPAGGPLVLVDLRTLDVTRKTLASRAPAAARKNVEGTTRTAVWTSWGTIAVAGRNASGGAPDQWTPAGLTLIDARTWTARTLDPLATDVLSTADGGAVLSWATLWDADARRSVGRGLSGYDGDGKQRFHVFAGQPVYIAAIVGRYAYVAASDLMRFRVVDTANGRVVAMPRTLRATTLAAP